MADDIGKIGWIDMTVENAEQLRDFYATVVGLKPEAVDLSGRRFCVIEDPNGAVAALYQP